MTLTQLIEAVKEEGLTKTQLEAYHTEITYLDNLMRMEIAPLEKLEALYFESHRLGAMGEKRTDIEIKRQWRAKDEGQRQIELSHYLKVTPKLLQSIKTRLYTIY
jgi:hypothetical protein